MSDDFKISRISPVNKVQKYPYPKYKDRANDARNNQSFKEALKAQVKGKKDKQKDDEYRRTHDTIEISDKTLHGDR